ncbi:MAG: bifunctional precorrin-2 dehydrogenase/sirohydrochlorin ferrochelatase [Desulfobacterales bacterium]
MRYYPINLDIRDRNCLVIGGGGVGTRKALGLLACGARVTVVSPDISARLLNLAARNALVLHQRAYREDDLQSMFLVIGATDDQDLNRRIHRDAENRGILCNIADRPEICNFILPSVVQRSELTISISTSGRSPALAKKLRRDLELAFGEEYGLLLQLMGAIRHRLLSEAHAPEAHKPLFEKLVNSDLAAMIREDRRSDIDRLLREVLGHGFTYDTLMEKSDPAAI